MEIEAKFKVDSHEPLRDRLRELHARREGAVVETNTLFDDAQGTLRKSDCGLRIRICRDPRGRFVRGLLTHKGPQQGGALKCREEIETGVDDPDAVARILEGVGFHPVVCFEKRRESWLLDDCVVELDEVPYLGAFIEIEGSEQAIRRVQGLLGLAEANPIPETYVALLRRYAQDRELSPLHLRF